MRPGRNDPCPCGSGRKFKKCCEAQRSAQSATPVSNPDRGDGRRSAETHYHQGNACHDRSALADAVLSYRRALQIDPAFPEAHNNLGDALLALGEPEAAVASFRSALALRPDYAEAHGNLGNALKQLGQLEEAVASYRRMLKIAPDVAEAHNNLGNTLLELKQLDAAAVSYRKAIELSPAAPGALVNLGNVLRDLGRPREAVAMLQRALDAKPDLADACWFLGNALFDLAQFDGAVVSYRKALEIEPDHAKAHTGLSIVLRQMGRSSEAEVSCRRALAIQPNSAETIAFLGRLEADKGRFAVAEDLFRQAITLDAESPEAWVGLALCRKMTEADAAWLPMAERLVEKRLPMGQAIGLRFAIGKYSDDIRNYQQAFTHYQLANELTKAYGVRHDRQRLTRRISQIIGLYSHEWLQRSRLQGSSSTRPVFIVGMPRSGTTLTEQILASHPAAFGAGELSFWNSATPIYETAVNRGLRDDATLSQLSANYLSQLAKLSPEALKVVDKMPANTMNLGLIHAALPNTRIIHMQRHPIDTCLSIYFQVFSNAHAYSNDLADLAHYYGEYRRVMAHWRATLPPGTILDVPYEGLVEDPESWSRQLLEFVGLPWDPRCLDFDQTIRTVTTASTWQVRQKINKTAVGRWRHYEPFVGPLRSLLDYPERDPSRQL